MSEINNEPIDIVIPWVNPNDKSWQKEFNYWKEKETGEKASVRFRDSNIFNYWFRGIEKNMSWIRYIYLILANETQIPEWLNINHPKLKIIYHREFIPNNELPTFNSSVINCYIPFIKELSENYILFNDDMFVIRKTYKKDFFRNSKVCGHYTIDKNPIKDGHWLENIYNNYLIINSEFNNSKLYFKADHGPIAYNKFFNQFIWKKYESKMNNALTNSKFRNSKNITDWIFYHAACLTNQFIQIESIVNYQNNIPIKDTGKQIICINDNERIKDFNLFVKENIKILKKFLNEKSSYEV